MTEVAAQAISFPIDGLKVTVAGPELRDLCKGACRDKPKIRTFVL